MPKVRLLKRTMTRDDLVHLAIQCAQEDGVDTSKAAAMQTWLDEQFVPFLRARLDEVK